MFDLDRFVEWVETSGVKEKIKQYYASDRIREMTREVIAKVIEIFDTMEKISEESSKILEIPTADALSANLSGLMLTIYMIAHERYGDLVDEAVSNLVNVADIDTLIAVKEYVRSILKEDEY